jgi:phosphoribosylamine--glycine ligase
MKKVEDTIVRPTIDGLKEEGIHYCGFIFVGIMNVGGRPYVIEYNARMGDPETQVVMPRIKSDFVELLVAAAKGDLKNKTLRVDSDFALTLALVSGGYPGDYAKGKKIAGLSENGEALVFHAGTKKEKDAVVTDGGRVLAVTGKGVSLEEARKAAYDAASGISWEDFYYRKDIGQDLLNYKV